MPQAGRESRWHRLLTTLRAKGKDGANTSVDASSLKHSHNCANNGLRVGVSNMKVNVHINICGIHFDGNFKNFVLA